MSDEMDDITRRRVARAKRTVKSPDPLDESSIKSQAEEALKIGVGAFVEYKVAAGELAKLIGRVGIQITQESSLKDMAGLNISADVEEATRSHAERMIQDAAEAAMAPIRLLVVPFDGGSLDDTHEAILVEYASEIVNAEDLASVLARLRDRLLHCIRPAVAVEDDLQYVQEFQPIDDEDLQPS